MPPRKRAAAKKTAAKKTAPAKKAAAKKTAAPEVVPELAPVEVPVDPTSDEGKPETPVEPAPVVEYTGPSFPLSGGFYYAKPSVARSGVSKGPGVAQVRKALGLDPGSNFDSDTRKALVEFQITRGLPVTGVVTSDVWEALHTPVE